MLSRFAANKQSASREDVDVENNQTNSPGSSSIVRFEKFFFIPNFLEGKEECLEALFERSVLCVLFDVEPLTILFDAEAELPGGGGRGGGIAYCAAGTEGGGGSPLPNECLDP